MTKHSRETRGQALVEFALVLPIMVFLLMGMFDLGRAVYAYSVVASAAREGARYAVIKPTDTAGIQAQALANTPGIGPLTMDAPVCKNISGSPASCSGGNTITITVHYTFQPVTGLFQSVNLVGKSTMTIE